MEYYLEYQTNKNMYVGEYTVLVDNIKYAKIYSSFDEATEDAIAINLPLMVKQLNNKYKHKAFPVEAIQWTGENFYEIRKFIDTPFTEERDGTLTIRAYEEQIKVNKNDFIIKSSNNHYTTCTQSMFEDLYDKV